MLRVLARCAVEHGTWHRFHGGASRSLAIRSSFRTQATEATIPAKIAARYSADIEVEKGKRYAYCTCGVSKNQPFCDGSHRGYNEMYGVTPATGGFKPMIWEAADDTWECFCQCKATKNPPFCDGSHNALDGDAGKEYIPEEYQPWEVMSTKSVSHDTKLLRLKCHEELEPANVSFHFSLQAIASDGSTKFRPYTPMWFDESAREMDLVVKKYKDGMVSPIIHSLKVGDIVELRGPIPGEYSVKRMADKHTSLALFAGGTGITPILQIATAVKSWPEVPSVHIFSCNKSDEDILCRQEIDMLGSQAHVKGAYHVLERRGNMQDAFEGRLSAEIIQTTLPAPSSGSHAVLCGPPLFNRAVLELLKNFGYTEDQITIC